MISLQYKGPSSLLQHHSMKASVLWCSAFFMVQLSHPYTTTGKTIALTIQTFVIKVMSLLFNTLLGKMFLYLYNKNISIYMHLILKELNIIIKRVISVQFSSVAQSCPTLCDPVNHNTPGLPVHHQLLESTQTHVHRVSDAIQPSHPLSFPSPPAPNPSQH